MFAIIVSVVLALTGLVNLVKYDYAYCGYIGLFAVVIPMLTIGHIKNKKFAEANPIGTKNNSIRPIAID